MSATQAGEVLGTSRVTARRYLEYLTESGLAERRSRYGGAGRPEVEYRWSGDDSSPVPPTAAPDGCPDSST
jgi:response regulator of citrate/malate metabolism